MIEAVIAFEGSGEARVYKRDTNGLALDSRAFHTDSSSSSTARTVSWYVAGVTAYSAG
jgi:hypothetical protein